MTARRKYRRGARNKLPGPVLPPPGTEWGPAMRALPSDRHRQFVISTFEVKPGYGANIRAAKLACFGTSTTTPDSWKVIASILAHDDKIQEAIYEESQRRLKATAPRAVAAAARLIEDPDHKDHARAIGMILDRVHPVQTTHTVNINHRKTVVVTTAEVLDKINELARRAGIAPDAMPPPMIDVTPTDKTT